MLHSTRMHPLIRHLLSVEASYAGVWSAYEAEISALSEQVQAQKVAIYRAMDSTGTKDLRSARIRRSIDHNLFPNDLRGILGEAAARAERRFSELDLLRSQLTRLYELVPSHAPRVCEARGCLSQGLPGSRYCRYGADGNGNHKNTVEHCSIFGCGVHIPEHLRDFGYRSFCEVHVKESRGCNKDFDVWLRERTPEGL